MARVSEGGTTTPLFFACWALHGDGRLTGAGTDVQLPPKEWQVLRLLLVSGGVLMTKDRLLEQASLLWKPIEDEHLAKGEDISAEGPQ